VLIKTTPEQRIRRGIQEITCIQFLGLIIRCDTVELRLIVAVKCRVCSCVGLRENITIIIVLALSPDVCALALSEDSNNFYNPTLQSVKSKPKFAAASSLHTAACELPNPRLYCYRLRAACFSKYLIGQILILNVTNYNFTIRLIKINLRGKIFCVGITDCLLAKR
jgi:hypothetical protein